MGKDSSASACEGRRAKSLAPSPNGPGSGVMALARRLVRTLVARRRRRDRLRHVQLHDLTALSDRTLADIGLRRADVQAAMIGILSLGRRAPS